MYTRGNTYVKNSGVELSQFVQNSDYANSELLYKLDKNTIWKEYEVTKYERRMDLISQDIYGNKNYVWILMYVNRIEINDIVRGVKLRYIPFDTLTAIINSI